MGIGIGIGTVPLVPLLLLFIGCAKDWGSGGGGGVW